MITSKEKQGRALDIGPKVALAGEGAGFEVLAELMDHQEIVQALPSRCVARRRLRVER